MSRPLLFRGFKSSQEILENGLGALERAVMAVAWRRDEISVRDACALLGSPVAYTTVMTTMDRLFKKGLLARRKEGRAFMYRAAATRNELEGAVATELVHSLIQRDGSEPLPVLSSLVDAVSDRDRALLDELERLIREKRRAIRRAE
jgi:predicted transcriptional regulator